MEVGGNEGAIEKSSSYENDVSLAGVGSSSCLDGTLARKGGILTVDDVNGKGEWLLDLNSPALESVDAKMVHKKVEIISVDSDDSQYELSFDDDVQVMESLPFVDEGGFINSKRGHMRKEKRKGILVDNDWWSLAGNESKGSLDLAIERTETGLNFDGSNRRYNEEGNGNDDVFDDNWLSIGIESMAYDDDAGHNLTLLSEAVRQVEREEQGDWVMAMAKERAWRRREQVRRRQEDILRSGTRFATNQKKKLVESSKLNFQQETLLIEWKPSRDKSQSTLTTHVPSLLDLSIDELAKNADAMVSLESVPDLLKEKLSKVVCDFRKMNDHFLKLLASGSPTEVRVWDCSWMTEGQFIEIFGGCDTTNLRVLQLDLCGQCLSDCALSKILSQSSFPALATISLRGAGRLMDDGLKALAQSAPSLQSVNLGQCSLLTSASIDVLASCLGSILKELYIDDCLNIDALNILPALTDFKQLEVLAVSGIRTVSDEFVIALVAAHGTKMKELLLADCVNLTDISIRAIGNSCRNLCVLDISNLHKLTDSAMRCLANGCKLIRVLKLHRNCFSDEEIAAFLEVSGSSLEELSLNYVGKVGPNTALSLSKYSRNLITLDLSWCRKLTDEALGLIVDSCLSLRLLKLFGCTQITNVFLNGHSNSSVQIIGQKTLPFLKPLNGL